MTRNNNQESQAQRVGGSKAGKQTGARENDTASGMGSAHEDKDLREKAPAKKQNASQSPDKGGKETEGKGRAQKDAGSRANAENTKTATKGKASLSDDVEDYEEEEESSRSETTGRNKQNDTKRK